VLGRWFDAEGREGICSQRREVESRSDQATPRYVCRRTWGTVEDSRISDKELLVARGH